MFIQQQLQHAISEALLELFSIPAKADEIKLEHTLQTFEGDFTYVVFPIVKQAKKSPEQTAQLMGEYLQNKTSFIEQFKVVKGFLNLTITSEYVLKHFYSFVTDAGMLKNDQGKGAKVMVEYSSPNTNKPLHLGHIRNNLLGYSVSEILKANGFHIFKANLINDRGIHICKSMLAWKKSGLNETPESTGMKGDHLVGKYYVAFDLTYKAEVKDLVSNGFTQEEAEKKAPSILEAQEMLRKWESGDSETMALWKMMNQWVYNGFDVSYKRLGVDFDKFYYESDTYLLGKDIVKEGLDKKVFFSKPDGSVWVDMADAGLDQKLLLRADGTSVYITQDIGTADLKYRDFAYTRSVYVVGNEQDYHFKVLSYILKKLEKPYAEAIYHLSYGMVDLPSGKMKSREGTVVDADDLMDEMHEEARKIILERGKTDGMDESQIDQLCEHVGMAALKYYLLRVEPQKRLLFNPAESIDFEGNTGPYLQYTNARINSLLSRAGSDATSATVTQIQAPEKQLMMALFNYRTALAKAAETYSPSEIANYLYELSKIFNRFYYECPVLKEDVPADVKAFRILLSRTTGKIISEGLRLLGIHAPAKM